MRIEVDDPGRADVVALLEEHFRWILQVSPPESNHALDANGLRGPDVTFWTMRDENALLGCGALKELGLAHGEIKSMHTPSAIRRHGLARRMLEHILGEARRRNYERVSLETGSMDAFIPARKLYESFGFSVCSPFGEYRPDPNSTFMTLGLD